MTLKSFFAGWAQPTALIVFLMSGAAAQETEGPRSPSAAPAAVSPDAAMELRLQGILKNLLEPAKLNVDVTLHYAPLIPSGQHCAAETLHANTALNLSDDPQIWTTPDILQAGPTDDHLAYVLAHELGHIKKDHNVRHLRQAVPLFQPWMAIRGGNGSDSSPYLRGLVARLFQSVQGHDERQASIIRAELNTIFLEEFRDRFEASMRLYESEADAYASDLISKSRYRSVGLEVLRNTSLACDLYDISHPGYPPAYQRQEAVFLQDTFGNRPAAGSPPAVSSATRR